ncbi:MAG: S49 family peptidase [Desulfurellales bacterium]|nr:MAG: S49 family peptidase [Desulfurellales bacterium]
MKQPHSLSRLATRIFGTPLLIDGAKAEVILSVLGDRVGLTGREPLPAPVAAAWADESAHSSYTGANQIAVIDVSGSLVNRASGLDAMSGITSYEQIQNDMKAAFENDAIRGLLLRIDSPGGECAGAFDLADWIRAQRGGKPIWAIIDDMACSAAYLIASQCDKIWVTQTGCVGSIGVIAMHVDRTAFDAAMGLKYTTLIAGARKADLSPHAPLSDPAREALQAEIDRLYGMFVSTVAIGRGMSVEDVRKTEAGVFFGPLAIEGHLADRLGTFPQAVQEFFEFTQVKVGKVTASAGPTSLMKKEVVVMVENTADVATTHTEETVPAAEERVEREAAVNSTPAATAAATAAPAAQAVPADPMLIMDLCLLAGLDLDEASVLMRSGRSEASVRAELITRRKASQAPSVGSPVRGAVRSGVVASQWNQMFDAKRVGQSPQRVQELAMALKSDPGLYEQYLAANPGQWAE